MSTESEQIPSPPSDFILRMQDQLAKAKGNFQESPWRWEPVPFREFVASPDHMNFPYMTPRQFEAIDALFPLDPKKTFKLPDKKNNLGVLTWGKGGGKDTCASIGVSYIVHQLLCLKHPYKFITGFDIDDASLDIVNVAYNYEQANSVFFTMLRNRIRRWKWLRENFTLKVSGKELDNKSKSVESVDARDERLVKIYPSAIVFPNMIRIFSTHSMAEGTEGKNILCFIIDEASSLSTGDDKEKANGDELLKMFRTSAQSRFPDAWTGFVMCLVKGTKISLVDGNEVPIEELVGRESFWVYSFDKEKQVIVPGRAKWARKSGVSVPVYRVTLDNGEFVRCTGNHPFLMRDGTYKLAEDLVSGDSLMPLYRRFDVKELLGYELQYSPVENRWHYAHRHFWNVLHPDNLWRKGVVSVCLDGVDDVYDLTVENYHNFALSCGVFVHNSFPRHQNDFQMKMHQEVVKGLHQRAFASKGATWEIIPSKPYENFRKEFENPSTKQDAETMYACNPPAQKLGFIELTDRITACVNKDRKQIVEFEPTIKKLPTGAQLVGKVVSKYNISRQPDSKKYVARVDLGSVFDRCSLTIGHQESNRVIIDLITHWQGTPQCPVDIDEPAELLLKFRRELIGLFYVSYDQWNSLSSLNKLNKAGVVSNKLSLGLDEYKLLRSCLYSKTIELLDYPLLTDPSVGELAQLQLIDGNKVDHPSRGHNDLSEGVCGVAAMLLGTKKNIQNVESQADYYRDTEQDTEKSIWSSNEDSVNMNDDMGIMGVSAHLR